MIIKFINLIITSLLIAAITIVVQKVTTPISFFFIGFSIAGIIASIKEKDNDKTS
jgi:uncharacterized membrane protein AbrB (regulator of aidB expression)